MQRGLDVPKKAFHYLGFWINSGCRRIALGVTGAGGTGTHNITAGINADTDWHKAVAIQDGKAGTISLFIDGVPQRQEPSVNISSGDMPLMIGFCDAESSFIGSVDEIKIYNCAKPADFKVTGVDVMEYRSFDYTDKASGESVTLPYRLFLPDGYKENDGKKYPLLFFLHGYGECGTDNMQQIRVLGGPNALLDRVVEKRRLHNRCAAMSGVAGGAELGSDKQAMEHRLKRADGKADNLPRRGDGAPQRMAFERKGR